MLICTKIDKRYGKNATNRIIAKSVQEKILHVFVLRKLKIINSIFELKANF